MTDKINGYGRTELPVSSSRSGSVKRADQSEATRNTGGEEKTRADAVSLTDTAVRLKQIEAELAMLPDIDQARVDELRSRIESDNYQVDSRELARRLVQLEQQLS